MVAISSDFPLRLQRTLNASIYVGGDGAVMRLTQNEAHMHQIRPKLIRFIVTIAPLGGGDYRYKLISSSNESAEKGVNSA